LGKIQASTALSSVRVLDLSRVRAGPTCARMLADFGADVVRIEPPAGVDPNDTMFAESRRSGDFQNLHRNKRGMTLNLKLPEGVAVLHRLVQDADVVIENWRPDVKARLGVDYPTLQSINPRIVLASISGFGQDGPYAKRPGFDQVIQGMSGLMSVTGFAEHGPVRAGIAIADSSTGLYAALGIFVALIERQQSGVGQWVQASLLHSQIAMMDFQVARYLVDGDVARQEGNDHPTASPMGMFHGSNGAFNLGVAGDGQWRQFCAVVGKTEWLDREDFNSNAKRVKHRAEIHHVINALFATQTVEHWVEILNQAGIAAGPLYTVPEMVKDVQVRHLNIVQSALNKQGCHIPVISQPVLLDRTPATVMTAAPERGEHTDEILAQAGYGVDAIAALHKSGAV
jgi:crotonobetainyl-CoA:carnitine CoA-transferase CaiB-like acyl-CoA transferase